MNNEKTKYSRGIQERTQFRYWLGFFIRLLIYMKYEVIRKIAIMRGASIGKNSNITLRLARKANKNLTVGISSIIETSDIDLRNSVYIGNNVIINRGVTITRESHDVDSAEFETTSNSLHIGDYCWIATNAFILPNCLEIQKGAVIGAGSVVGIKRVLENQIVCGNPAKVGRMRKMAHRNIVVEALQGRDLIKYYNAR